jgi:hypothetical protein
VVTAHDAGVNLGGNHSFNEILRNQEVVDAPSDVASASVGEVGPPGVVTIALLEESKGVDEPGVYEILKASTFLSGVTRFARVGLGISKVVGSVRHVQVTAEDDRFRAFKLCHVLQERWIPKGMTKLKSSEIPLGVRGVDGDKKEIWKFRRENSTLAVRIAERVIAHFERINIGLR